MKKLIIFIVIASFVLSSITVLAITIDAGKKIKKVNNAKPVIRALNRKEFMKFKKLGSKGIDAKKPKK